MNKKELIRKDDVKDHAISSYEFKTIEDLDSKNSHQAQALEERFIEESAPESSELMNSLLSKIDTLSTNLANMEINLKRQEEALNEKIEIARKDGFESGLKEGIATTKKELEAPLEGAKANLISAISKLDNLFLESKDRLSQLEVELSEIAVEMAKQVIVKEVSLDSKNVALSLARSLIESVKDAVNIALKVSPEDYLHLKENLELKNVSIESSDAVHKGGVILSCSLGEMQGDLQKRFEILKTSMFKNV